ncbi:MAG TPA: TIGR03086 family metal-binding protein [Actinomycetes bacterium]|nr:TIGR03086 family metal-binding protein [Actinomycetes bacterium]
MSVRTDAAANHARTAATFTQRVEGADQASWDAPSPVAGWAARDVVRHLVTWLPGFLERGTDITLPNVPSVDDDPVTAWKAHATNVQSLLDDPATDDRIYHSPMMGDMPLAEAIDRFYTSDIFMHTWDLARATDQDDTLDEERCRELYEGMLPMDDLLRTSGQFGPRIDVPDTASYQDKLIGFIGRQP